MTGKQIVAFRTLLAAYIQTLPGGDAEQQMNAVLEIENWIDNELLKQAVGSPTLNIKPGNITNPKKEWWE